ncbi:uncharacterized protein LOC119968612 isoform X1 [Scyliorhinus canicula]|uniref:uncharacterized protein LOC119968612 isoform X1 n=1 Tax=Scyliorhinus canicula TaxID=7830 RepID=UPI0018F49871|nr:uncharacterized protein LOC119968612 isoform X1 [Scyliorhinus canicula]
MKWTRNPLMAALYSWWLLAVLQAAAAGSITKVVNGTVNGNIFLAIPAMVIAEQIHTIDWTHVSPTSRHSIVQFIPEKDSQEPYWFGGYHLRAQIYPNGSLSIQNIMLNDTGTYSCTITTQNGEEFTQDTIVNVIGGVVIIDETADSNLTHVKANETNDYVIVNCGFIAAFSGAGALIVIAILTWAIVRYCKKRSRRQGKGAKEKQSHNESEDVYENMGRVPQEV